MDSKQGLLVVMAHPDDESMGCGGVILRHTRAGIPVHLICATRGEAGWTGKPIGAKMEDLAEIRTVAVMPDRQGLGIGHAIVGELLARARVLGIRRVFCLTFAVDFFARHGFQPISGTPVAAEVYSELLRSYDEGVAEFLDLERVKPNTLGNIRMLLRLLPER